MGQGVAFALKHEAKLIRELKPKFNRAGVRQGKPQFLVWRFSVSAVEFSVQETPKIGWERFGSLGVFAPRLRSVLVRLLWLTMNPDQSLQEMPLGWMQNRMAEVVKIEADSELRAVLEEAFWGSSVQFLNWLAMRLNKKRPAFELVGDSERFGGDQEIFGAGEARKKVGAEGVDVKNQPSGVHKGHRFHHCQTSITPLNKLVFVVTFCGNFGLCIT